MKKKITQTLLPIIMGLSVITQFACSDDNKSGSNYNGPLKLTTFYPDSGYLSSKIIIEGENLGTDASKLSVYFNKKKGYISQAAGNILDDFGDTLNCLKMYTVKQEVDTILAEISPVQLLKAGD